MHGVTGMCTWSPAGLEGGSFDAMMAAMAGGGLRRRAEARTPGGAFGAFTLTADEGLASDGGTLLAFVGDAPYREALAAGLDGATPADPLPAILLARYRAGGARALANINGVYAAAVWDEAAQRLHIVTDRFGYRKLYYWRTAERVVFSTACSAILAHPACPDTVDPEAMAELLAYRYVSGQRTYWPHIRLAPPGSILTFGREGESTERYWTWDYRPGDTLSRPEADYAAEMWEIFREAVAVRVEPGMVFPLTGGMDSRCITAAALRERPGGGYGSATIGQRDSLEYVYAKRLAKDLGIEHALCPIGPDYLARYGAEAVRRSEGMTIDHTCWRMAIEPYLSERGAGCTMNGFLGVVAKGGTLMNEFDDESDPAAMKAAFMDRYAGATTAGELRSLLRPAYKDLAAAPYETIERRFSEEAPGETLFDRDAYFEFMHFECRYIGVAFDYCAPRFRIRTPIADHRFMDFCLSMPRPLRRHARLMHRMLVTYLPEAARAPYVKTGLPPGAGSFERLLRKAWGRAYYRFLPKIRMGGVRNRNVYVRYSEWLRTGSRPYVETLLAERDRLSEWFEPDAVARLIQEHYEGATNRYGQVYGLLTLLEWRRQFAP